MNPSVALLWVHFGPYHLARLRALQKRCSVTAIQFASGQQMYGWDSDAGHGILTLCDTVHERAGACRAVQQLWRLLRERRPDVLLIPGYRETLAITAAVWGRLNGRTNVLMSDSTALDLPRSRWKEKAKGIVARALFQNAFVSGQRAALYLRSLTPRPLVRETGYDVVDNGYFETRVARIRAENARDVGTGPFLFVGRLHPFKNIPLLLDAFAEYRRQGGNRHLEIVGKGPLEHELKHAVAGSNIREFVTFSGYQTYESLPEYYARARCLILPSLSEPWGLVVNEAMASGLPVIVSDRCGCVDDLVEDGRNGFVFPARSLDALTERMFQVDALSAAEWTSMSGRSREISARFSPEAWADAVLRLAQGQSTCSTAA